MAERETQANWRGCYLIGLGLSGLCFDYGFFWGYHWFAVRAACVCVAAVVLGFIVLVKGKERMTDDSACVQAEPELGSACPVRGWRNCLCSGPPDYRLDPNLVAPEDRDGEQ